MPRQTIRVTRGETLKLGIPTPWDLSAYTISAQLRNRNGDGDLLGTFTTTVETNPQTNLPGLIRLSLPATSTDQLTPGASDLCFDVKLQAPNDEVTYLPKTYLTVGDRVTV